MVPFSGSSLSPKPSRSSRSWARRTTIAANPAEDSLYDFAAACVELDQSGYRRIRRSPIPPRQVIVHQQLTRTPCPENRSAGVLRGRSATIPVKAALSEEIVSTKDE